MNLDAQNRLEESLFRAASEISHRPQFYRDLMESDLFIIKKGSSLVGNEFIERESIQEIEWQGRIYVPIFSSLLRLHAAVDRDVEHVALSAREIVSLTRGSNLFLNPGSKCGKEFLRDEVSEYLDLGLH